MANQYAHPYSIHVVVTIYDIAIGGIQTAEPASGRSLCGVESCMKVSVQSMRIPRSQG